MSEGRFALAGVVFGAASTGVATWLHNRRREKREVRAAARLLRSDLLRAHGMLSATLSNQSWWSRPAWSLPTDLWREERRHLAVEFKDFNDWEPIARAFVELDDLNLYVAALESLPDPDDEGLRYDHRKENRRIEEALELVRQGIARIDELVGAETPRHMTPRNGTA
jgi:hypothetical protein